MILNKEELFKENVSNGGTTMKVSIEVEQYDNGISLKWSNEEAVEDKAVVALDADKESAIGKMIWSDIENFMNLAIANKVKMEINFLVEDSK